MQFYNIIHYLAFAANIAIAAPTEAEISANLPGLNAVQSGYARSIIAKAKAESVGRHGCEAAIATALVEVCSHMAMKLISADAMMQVKPNYVC